jgi:hypothetical protein
MIELSLELKIQGESFENLRDSVAMKIAEISDSPTNFHRKQHERLQRIQRQLNEQEEIERCCGVCFSEFDTENPQSYLTTCCAFRVCFNCIEGISKRGREWKCPKCRDNVCSLVGFNVDHALHTRSAVKDLGSFRGWLESHDFRCQTRRESLFEVLNHALNHGLTHIIIRGPLIHEWRLTDQSWSKEYSFVYFRNPGVRGSMKRTCESLDRFCTDDDSQILLLDSSEPVCGIDAKKTDLIIEICDASSADLSNSIQLRGRALRLGRVGHAVIVRLD